MLLNECHIVTIIRFYQTRRICKLSWFQDKGLTGSKWCQKSKMKSVKKSESVSLSQMLLWAVCFVITICNLMGRENVWLNKTIMKQLPSVVLELVWYTRKGKKNIERKWLNEFRLCTTEKQYKASWWFPLGSLGVCKSLQGNREGRPQPVLAIECTPGIFLYR